MRCSFHNTGARAMRRPLALFFYAARLKNALNFSGSVLIEAGNVIETHEHKGDFKER
jgi:hypothetical protein